MTRKLNTQTVPNWHWIWIIPTDSIIDWIRVKCKSVYLCKASFKHKIYIIRNNYYGFSISLEIILNSTGSFCVYLCESPYRQPSHNMDRNICESQLLLTKWTKGIVKGNSKGCIHCHGFVLIRRKTIVLKFSILFRLNT